MDPILHPASDQLLSNFNGGEKYEDLLLFHEMRKVEVTADGSISHQTVKASAAASPLKENVGHEDIFSSSEWDKNDYDWLMTPPATPFLPSMEKGLQCNGLSIDGTSTAPGSEAKPEPTVRSEPSSKVVRGDLGFKQPGTGSGHLLSTVDTNLHSFASSANIASRQSSSYSLSGSPSIHSSRQSARPSTPTRPQSLVRPSTPTRSSQYTTQPSTPTLTRSSGGSQPSPRPSTPNRLNVSSQPSPRPSTPSRSNVCQASPRSSTPSRSSGSFQPVRSSTPTRTPARSSTPTRSVTTPNQASARSSTPTRSVTTPNQASARPSTPTRSSGTPRASTPSNTNIRPSTPTSRSTVPSAWPASSIRSSTPVKRPSTPTGTSTPQNTISKTSSASKSNYVPAKGGGPCRPSSPASRTRQPGSHPAAPGLSQDPLPNLRTSTGDRHPSNPRASLASRSTASATKAEPSNASYSGPQNRRTSCSPVLTRGRSFNGDNNSRNSKVVDGASGTPLSSGTFSNKMVDITTSTKVLPSSQDKLSSMQVKTTVKSYTTRDSKPSPVSKESSGFGRSLSKKSLDMALRHMDIRSSAPAGFRTFMSNVPTSSLYSVRSGNSRGNSAADSPMATSSNASSEHSMTIGVEAEGSDLGEETFFKKDTKTSSNAADLLASFSNDRNTNGWLSSSDYIEDNSTDIMQIFEQGRLSSSESPLIPHQGGTILCDDFSLDSIHQV